MRKGILFAGFVVALVVCFGCGPSTPSGSGMEYQRVASGVWKVEVGQPDKVNLLSELEFTPKIDAINTLDEVDLPVDKAEITAEVFDGKTYLRFPLDKEEKIYGLGLNFKSVQQRGRITRLHVDHYGGSDNGRTHAPVPFFVSSKGYGVHLSARTPRTLRNSRTATRTGTGIPSHIQTTWNSLCRPKESSWCSFPERICWRS